MVANTSIGLATAFSVGYRDRNASPSTRCTQGAFALVLQTQVELSKRVEIVSAEEAAILIADAEEVGRMLHGLIGSLERTNR